MELTANFKISLTPSSSIPIGFKLDNFVMLFWAVKLSTVDPKLSKRSNKKKIKQKF